MTQSDDNRPGYYDEIPYPRDKKDELLAVFKGFEIEVHTNDEEEFDYLEDNDFNLTIKNPYHNKDIDIELAGEFSLFFGEWHAHFPPYVYDYNDMIETIKEIINNQKCAITLFVNGEWFGSSLSDSAVSLEEYLKDEPFGKEQLRKIREGKAEITACFWKP